MRKIRALIVDDSVVIRRVVSHVLGEDPGIEVAGIAAHGRIALAKLPDLAPDLIVLDVEMPVMDGLETLKAIRAQDPDLPVIMFSSLTEQGAETTLTALSLGASDYVAKPANLGSLADVQAHIRERLVAKVKALGAHAVGRGAAGGAPVSAPAPAALEPAPAPERSNGEAARHNEAARIDVVAIGCSTGGPNALAEVLPALPAALPVPVVIVQHMPPVFTAKLAKRLHKQSAIDVFEGAEGDALRPGAAWIAPGDRHMEVARRGTGVQVHLHEGRQENSCRPAVDVLFRSVAGVYGAHALGVVLTGMGRDGLRGAERIAEAGGRVLAQDEASSVVWGMPGAVTRAKLSSAVLSLDRIGPEIAQRVTRSRTARKGEIHNAA